MDFDDKPRTMPIKDFLIRILSVKNRMSEKTVDAIITHQFKSCNQAMYLNDTVEISGFGTLHFNVKKAQKRRAHVINRIEAITNQLPNASEIMRVKYEARLKYFQADLEWLNSKLK